MIVMKFGGTSVQNEEAIKRAIEIVRRRLNEKPLVVVSAMSKVTRLLCKIAEEAENKNLEEAEKLIEELKERHLSTVSKLVSGKLLQSTTSKIESLFDNLNSFVNGVCQIGELSKRSEAKIVSFGELLSSVIVDAAMNDAGIKSKWVDARILITTNEDFMSATVNIETTSSNIIRTIPEEFKGAEMILTQGFIASTSNGTTSLLGFEGSDYSAALFGMALDAERVEIWTDVDGIRTADPRIVENTGRIERISYEEAAEMAYLGARVLHPLTIEPTKKKNIPICVLNSANPKGEGSKVVRKEDIEDGPKSVAYRDDIDFIVIQKSKPIGISNFLFEIFETLSKYKIKTSLITTSESGIAFTAEAGQSGIQAAINILSEKMDVTVFKDKVQISIVGKNTAYDKALTEIILSLTNRFYLLSHGADSMNISFVIDKENSITVLNKIHEALFKTK